jgi:acyl carrier protein
MLNTLIALIANALKISEDGITEATTFVEDLGMDSLDAIDMVTAVEEEFDIEVDDKDIETLKTVGDALAYIQNKQNLNEEKDMAKKPTFTENDMAHELNKRAKAKGIDISIEATGVIMDEFEAVVTEQLQAGKIVKMRNFGSFEVKEQKARNRYNPATKQVELFPAHNAPKFDASDVLKEAVK